MSEHVDSPHAEEKEPRIRRGKVDSLTLYEITDHELDVLERGSPSSIELNFAIALLSALVTIITTLMTATFDSPVTRSAFLLASFVSGVLGTYFLVKWLRTHNDVKDTIKKIKDRVPDDPEDTPAAHSAMPLPPADTNAEQAG